MNDFENVYAFVRTIPRGRVMGYGQVGDVVGVSARTVGRAMHHALDEADDPQRGVPWQRVVGADGYLRIARRDVHLRDLQKSLLEAEGVTVSEAGYVDRAFFVNANEGYSSPSSSASASSILSSSM
jgi:methylated-DNA-protein-cysteine methyltransferase-like protein